MSNKMIKIYDAESGCSELKLDDLTSWETGKAPSTPSGECYIILYFKNHTPITLNFNNVATRDMLIMHLERVMPVALWIFESERLKTTTAGQSWVERSNWEGNVHELKNVLERVDCTNLVPAKATVPRPHCECNGMEGDCYIYLGKASTCRFRVKRETKS